MSTHTALAAGATTTKMTKTELVHRVASHPLFVGAAHDLRTWSKADLATTYAELTTTR